MVFTDYESQADKLIYFVEYESQADLKIYFVKYGSHAGWRKRISNTPDVLSIPRCLLKAH